MAEKVWLGKIFLKEGHGDKIVIKALTHYKKRLATISSDPQVKEFGMAMAMLVGQEGQKTSAQIQPIIDRINIGVLENSTLDQVSYDVPLIIKALNCYQADIQKIVKNMQEKCGELFDEPKNLNQDLPMVAQAIEKINQFE